MDEGWSLATLRAYVDALLLEREHHFTDMLEAQQRAVEKAEQALAIRLEAMNEIRDQLREQAATFATKDEMQRLRDEVGRRFDQLFDPQTGVYARTGLSQQNLRTWAIALLTAILMLMIGLVVHLLGSA